MKEKGKGIFAEFKKFILRGNIVDMAVGVIIGTAFSAIVTSLVNKIFMPLVNWVVYLCTGGESVLLITILNGEAYFLEDGTTINDACIYIDWGNFIQAIVNFLLIAVILFIIVKVFNKIHEDVHKKETLAKKAADDAKAKADAEQAAIAEAEAKAKADAEKAEIEAVRQATIDQAKILAEIKEIIAKK